MRKANQKSRNDGVGELLCSAELRFIMCTNGNLVEMHPSTREVKGGSYRTIDIVRVTAGTIHYCKVPTTAAVRVLVKSRRLMRGRRLNAKVN